MNFRHIVMLLGLALALLNPAEALARDARHMRAVRRPAEPPVVVAHISVARQTLTLTVNGWPHGWWSVSTAGQGYHTPRGNFRVQRLERVWFSKKYDNSPMPNSVFFDGGIAIHGSYHIRTLGMPVSHGCVRLAPDHAAELYELVEQYGPSRTQIIVTDF